MFNFQLVEPFSDYGKIFLSEFFEEATFDLQTGARTWDNYSKLYDGCRVVLITHTRKVYSLNGINYSEEVIGYILKYYHNLSQNYLNVFLKLMDENMLEQISRFMSEEQFAELLVLVKHIEYLWQTGDCFKKIVDSVSIGNEEYRLLCDNWLNRFEREVNATSKPKFLSGVIAPYNAPEYRREILKRWSQVEGDLQKSDNLEEKVKKYFFDKKTEEKTVRNTLIS